MSLPLLFTYQYFCDKEGLVVRLSNEVIDRGRFVNLEV